jgi:hypothetical protein
MGKSKACSNIDEIEIPLSNNDSRYFNGWNDLLWPENRKIDEQLKNTLGRK